MTSRKAASTGTVAAPARSQAAAEKTPPELTVDADLWLSVAGRNLAGSRRVALLAEIGRAGSITQAAKAAGLSYKGAWDAIEQMSNLAGEPLVERVTGGKGGGHSHLTQRGTELVRNFELIQAEHQHFVERLNRHAGGLTRDYSTMGKFAIKTSARNQFAGSVSKIREGAVNDEVELTVIGGQVIVATVTRNSRIDLGLQVGSPAIAIIKASSILLMTRCAAEVRLSARNQLVGKVTRVTPGAVNAEIVLSLTGGGSIAAIITQVSADELGLQPDDDAVVLFKASSVILGVAA